MKTIIDEDRSIVEVHTGSKHVEYALASEDGFKAVSRAWLRAGWDTKHVYSFSWFGRPIIQLPEDMFRLQEVIYQLKPDVVVETGVAHGGSLVFYASLFQAMGRGRVIGVDIEIRPHNRRAIESHELAHRISLVEGSSVDSGTFDRVLTAVGDARCVLVVLDANHTYDHVLREMELYSKLVTKGSYIIVTDGIMKDLVGAPRTKPDWATNNPHKALIDFVSNNPGFAVEEPEWLFNESLLSERITYWPDAFVRKVS